MKMKHRAAAFYAVAGLSLLAIAGALGERLGMIPVYAILWLVVVGVVQSALLKCPHCGKSVVFSPQGPSLAVGDKCKHCGKLY